MAKPVILVETKPALQPAGRVAPFCRVHQLFESVNINFRALCFRQAVRDARVELWTGRLTDWHPVCPTHLDVIERVACGRSV